MLFNRKYIYFLPLLLMLCCKQAYEPPAVRAVTNFLVVDGFVNASPGSKTTFLLSRSRNLVDTLDLIPELNAEVLIEARTGSVIRLNAEGKGVYSNSQPVTINRAEEYRISIRTKDGRNYVSDYVPVRQSPMIDSLSWKQDKDLIISVSSHDPANATRYYRWEYEETYEYHSSLKNFLGLQNGFIFYRDSSLNRCWATTRSTDIILGNSVKLQEDRIDQNPVVVLPDKSLKLQYRYSALVNQYALTEDAFNYWQTLQKNTQQLGTLFDPQPSQLKGNIHAANNPAEPVLGYFSVSSVQSKRILISNSEVRDWVVTDPGLDCQVIALPQDPAVSLRYTYPDTTYYPYYFTTGTLFIAKRFCVDCTTRGGSVIQPPYW